jgi:HD-like signal output (HDOD) protein
MTPEPDSAASAALPGAPDNPDALLSVVASVTEVSSLPAVALRIMQVAGDPQAGAADLKAVIEADPSLCVRVLRCLNSASFGLRNEVHDLNQAVAYLGLRQIRDLAITATISDLFRRGEPVHTYQRPELWRHLVAVAICSRMIGVRTRMAGFEEAFLAGLIHDLGIILFDQYRHDDFRRVITCLNSSRTLPEFERRTVGWDHTHLGELVASQWNLPEAPLAAIRYHHEPGLYDGPHREIVHCVSVANLICSLRDLTSVGINLVRLAPESLDVLGIRKSDLKILTEDLGDELEANQHLFDLQKG